MMINSCIMFESVGVVNSVMLELWRKKFLGSTLSRNTRQAYPIGLTVYQAKLLGLATPVRPKSWVWQVLDLDVVCT